jgi:hypothetical protein
MVRHKGRHFNMRCAGYKIVHFTSKNVVCLARRERVSDSRRGVLPEDYPLHSDNQLPHDDPAETRVCLSLLRQGGAKSLSTTAICKGVNVRKKSCSAELMEESERECCRWKMKCEIVQFSSDYNRGTRLPLIRSLQHLCTQIGCHDVH